MTFTEIVKEMIVKPQIYGSVILLTSLNRVSEITVFPETDQYDVSSEALV